MDFTDKVAVVTGAANGIGLATSRLYARHGARVVLVDWDEANGQKAAKAIEAEGGKAMFIAADMTKADDVAAFVDATVKKWGAIDCFFNNAGIIGKEQYLDAMDEDNFDRVIAVNLRGTWLGLRHVLPVMIARERGAIVNMGSIASIFGSPGGGAYVASKHAVLGLTRTAASEVARYGIRVNIVCPGSVDTNMIRAIEQMRDTGNIAAVSAGMQAGSPLGRYATPDEVANVVLFLSSDEAGYVNGAEYMIDGGRSGMTWFAKRQ